MIAKQRNLITCKHVLTSATLRVQALNQHAETRLYNIQYWPSYNGFSQNLDLFNLDRSTF